MTDQRRAELEASRQRAELRDQQKAMQGAIVDGVQQIQAALSRPASESEAGADALTVMAGKGAGAGAGTRTGTGTGTGRRLRVR